jgi:hypothetical protein
MLVSQCDGRDYRSYYHSSIEIVAAPHTSHGDEHQCLLKSQVSFDTSATFSFVVSHALVVGERILSFLSRHLSLTKRHLHLAKKRFPRMSSPTRPNSTTPLLQERRRSSIHSSEEERVSTDVISLGHDVELKASIYLGLESDFLLSKWRILATFFSFVVVGAVDGAYGV